MRVAVRFIAVVLFLVSFPAAASDFGIGFLIAMAGIFMIAIWPLVLPLFYLRGSSRKLTLYFVLALTAFGLAGLLSAPFQLLGLIGLPALLGGSLSSDNIPGAGVLYLAHPLAFAASLWVLPKIKRLVASHAIAP